jgi:[protein-PII] uridylyltransferase
MIDTFQVTAADGAMVPYEEVWHALERDLREVLIGSRWPPGPPPFVRPSGAVISVPTIVEFDNETSETLTIIDITARDRVGLLYLITRTLYELNLDIASAKIATEGARALDTFYVSDLLRNKIVDPDRQERIRRALISALTASANGRANDSTSLR